MGKRGRKPKEKKGYFYDTEEEAIVKYINETDTVEKNRIFNNILYPAFTKMIESIIRRYKLFVPDEEFEQNFNDTISYLLTKINHFNPDSGHKAYSYCGTVCRNYLMYKCSQYYKKKLRNSSYDDVYDEISNDEKFSTEDDNYSNIAEKLIVKISDEIEDMINHRDENGLNDNEVLVGKSLITLLRNWEEVLPDNGSNKLQKSSVLYFLREDTMMSTKEIRENMKRYKNAYNMLKSFELE